MYRPAVEAQCGALLCLSTASARLDNFFVKSIWGSKCRERYVRACPACDFKRLGFVSPDVFSAFAMRPLLPSLVATSVQSCANRLFARSWHIEASLPLLPQHLHHWKHLIHSAWNDLRAAVEGSKTAAGRLLCAVRPRALPKKGS